MSNNDLRLSDEAAGWFARLRRGDLSEEDLRDFESWRRRTPEHEQAWIEVTHLWSDPAIIAAARVAGSAFPTCGAARRSAAPRRGLMTAAVGLLGAIACLFLVRPDLVLQLQADDWTATGEQRSVQLPDGSGVTLNTRTAIATEFLGQTRRIKLLAGEAFFRVSPDPQKPFLVESHNMVARALGTAFLVKEEGDGLQVAVIEGSVDVHLRDAGSSHIELNGGQQVAIARDHLSPPTTANPEVLTAWLRGRLVFDSAPLSQVINELNRYHAGRIVLVGTDIRQIQVSGTYHLSDTSAIVDTLVQTLPIHRIQLTHRLVLLY